MQFKGIKTIINEQEKAVKLPDKKTVVLQGENKENIMYLIETLLSRDYTDYYAKIDRNYGFYYFPLSKISVLEFTNGKIIGKKSTIKINGEIPKIHCIRYVKDGIIRSFLCSDYTEKNNCALTENLTRYTDRIDETIWNKLLKTVNDFIGYDVVTVKDKELHFNFTPNQYSVEAQKTIYMLISECFITPSDYLRIVLLSDIETLTVEQQLELIKVLDNIKGHEMLFTTCPIEDKSDEVIGFLKV